MAVKSGSVYFTNPDGKAPPGLTFGDIVVTGKGGTYAIVGVNPDGSYQSTQVDANINKGNFNPTNEGLAPQIGQGQETQYAPDPNQAQIDGLINNQNDRINNRSSGGTISGGTGSSGSNSPSSPTYDADIKAMIDQLSEAQKANQIAGLTSAMNSALGNLDTQQAGVKGEFYDKRNQAAGNSDVGAMNFAQYMASRGIKGNAGAMPEIYRNAGLQNQLGALGQQEAQINTGIDNQRTTVKNKFGTDVEAAKAAIDAQALEMYMNQLNTDRAFDMQNQQMINEQIAAEKAGYANNIGAFSNDFMTEINRVQGDGDPGNDWQIPYLQAARNEKLAAKAAEDAAATAALAKTGGTTGGTLPAAPLIEPPDDPLNDPGTNLNIYPGANVQSPGFNQALSEAQRMKSAGASQDDIAGYIAGLDLTPLELSALVSTLGINLNA